MNFCWAYLTDIGVKRQNNEDSALGLVLNLDVHGERDTLGFFAVSDGMGGKEKGELASKIAVKTLGEAFIQHFLQPSLEKVTEIANYGQNHLPPDQNPEASPAAFLTRAIQEANSRVSRIRSGTDRIRLGATVTAAILFNELLTIGHVGDCRCYLYFENSLRMLTRDHTMVGDMLRKGLINPDEARQHPHRNVLARALGSHDTVEVDTAVSVIGAGCKILLCTDGLYNMVSEDEIKTVLASEDHPQHLVQELVGKANAAGGMDNVTALLIQIFNAQ